MQGLELHKSRLITQVLFPRETKYEVLFDEVQTVQEQYVVITLGLAAVGSFCSWLLCSKKCGRGVMIVQHPCVSGIIKGMRKRGEFNISLSNLKGRKILNSNTKSREPMGGGGGERGVY